MSTDEKKKTIIIGIALLVVVIIAIILLMKGCAPKEYTITFNSNGGTTIESLKIKEDGTIERPINPTREGYTFDGWYYNGKLFDFTTKITKDMTLEARWSKQEETEVKIVVDNNSVSLVVGDEKTIKASLSDNSTATFTYSSSDSKVVSVDSNGKVKGLKEGKATITITTKDGKYTTTVEVTVTKEEVKVTGVSISGASSVIVGKTIKLTANISPKEATNKEVTWKSSNTKVATVDKNGNVKGLKAGTVEITVTTKDGNKTATKKITVKAEETKPSNPSTPSTPDKPDNPSTPSKVAVSGVTLDKSSLNLKTNGTAKLTATVNPSNATNKKVKWESSNPSVVTVVQEDGNIVTIKAVGEGKATITVTTEDGNYKAECEVTVEATYAITFTKLVQATGASSQYEVTVKKDGTTFTSYKHIELKGGTYRVTPGQKAFDTWLSDKPTSVVLVLADGTRVTVTDITYNERTIE